MYSLNKPYQQNNQQKLDSDKYLKYVSFAAAGIAGILLSGFMFRILASTIRGFKELKRAIQL